MWHRASAFLLWAVVCAGVVLGARLLFPGETGPRAVAHAHAQVALVKFPSASLGIKTSDDKVHQFKIEVATKPEERAQGLMFRRTLAPDAGMLFDFGRTDSVAMWMKNTFIPLDMLFITSDGSVVNIAQRTVPESLTAVPSAKPVRYVLEVPGGTASRLGLKPGDKVLYPSMGTAAP
jgi:uncharacterized membrane protein (UPF0127 family)